jgi:hypothetical protein
MLQSWVHSPRSQCWPAGQSALMTQAGWSLIGGGGAVGPPAPASGPAVAADVPQAMFAALKSETRHKSLCARI